MQENQKKEDLRIRRTKKLLSNALFELIKKKPFDKVSVCDICDAAMVHRATFYSHFSDKYELLTYSIDEHIPLDKLEFSAHGTDGAVNPEKVVGDIINYVASNKDIYAFILKKNNDYSIPDRIQDLFEEKILKIVNRAVENGEEIPVKPEFLASFYSGACLNVVTKWLQGGMPLTADELIGNLNTLLSLSHIH